MIDDALPEAVMEIPRDITRNYFQDGTAFGAPLAAPQTEDQRQLAIARDALAKLRAELLGERMEVRRLSRLYREMSEQVADVLVLHNALIAENRLLRERLAERNDDTLVVDVDHE